MHPGRCQQFSVIPPPPPCLRTRTSLSSSLAKGVFVNSPCGKRRPFVSVVACGTPADDNCETRAEFIGRKKRFSMRRKPPSIRLCFPNFRSSRIRGHVSADKRQACTANPRALYLFMRGKRELCWEIGVGSETEKKRIRSCTRGHRVDIGRGKTRVPCDRIAICWRGGETLPTCGPLAF